MRAIVKSSINSEDAVIEERSIPSFKKEQSLIKVLNVGICGSDLHMYYGDESYEWINFPLVLGHEIVGEVVESSNAKLLHKKVVIDPYTPCGRCNHCLNNEENLCDEDVFYSKKTAPLSLNYGFREDGGMAELIAVNNKNCIVIDDDIDLKVAGISESIAVGFHAIKKVDYKTIKKEAPILIFGPGPIGLGMLTLLRGLDFQNITIVGTEKDEKRLLKANELGAQYTYTSAEELKSDLQKNNIKGYEFIFETSGHPSTIDTSMNVISKGGSIVLVGISNLAFKVPMDELVRGEVNLKGSYGINRDSLLKVIEFSRNDNFNFSKLIDDIYPYYEYKKAFNKMRSGQVSKILLEF